MVNVDDYDTARQTVGSDHAQCSCAFQGHELWLQDDRQSTRKVMASF